MNAAALLAGARRVVVKVGSSLLIQAEGGVRAAWLARLADDVAALRGAGKEVVVVSSGAVALGRRHLGLRPSGRLDHKQAAAAAGQTLLMQAWEAAFAPHAVPTAQLLLTFDDTERRRRWLNARATIAVLLAQGALPVINENDSVATDELRYGDNDRLSARVAQMIKADLLLLLSDVDGLYSADPARDPEAEHIAEVQEVDASIEAMAAGPASGIGSGGMRSKLVAARIASGAGCATLIASGRDEHPIDALAKGGAGDRGRGEGLGRRRLQAMDRRHAAARRQPRRRCRRGEGAGRRQEPAPGRHRRGDRGVRARRLPLDPRS
jgi:glutamate 5-kinase